MNSVNQSTNSLASSTTPLPSYLTGNYPLQQTEPTYPVYKNTRTFPDQHVRELLQTNNYDVMFLTITEIFEVLQSWGWKETKTAWVEATQSGTGQVMINYGTNGRDVVTTSMIIAQLGSLGIKGTVYRNHKGTELIKLTGYSGIRKILNAPVFGLKNPKVVDLGIGKYGLKNSIISGARVTFYFVAAYRVLDFILNDETELAGFLGGLATDVVKIGISSTVAWGAGAMVSMTPFIIGPLVAVVIVGTGTSMILNMLDEKYHLTDKVVEYIEHSQQEMVEKARDIEDGFWDLGAMMIDGMLETGKEIIVSELKIYVRKTINEIVVRSL
ncbi:PAAR domain-containing protein [Vibrio algivorus]|uniref:PAAR domain-containing protein n=1 Tax=Vibrio algivorus TaxID=1667024 RepID=A0A557NV49_9VIBR|nr:PAAR domain-containing protein [Vibrio algivorus]